MKSSVERDIFLSKFFSYITWLGTTLGDLQTRPLSQILSLLRNNSLAILKLETMSFKTTLFSSIRVTLSLPSTLLEKKDFAVFQRIVYYLQYFLY